MHKSGNEPQLGGQSKSTNGLEPALPLKYLMIERIDNYVRRVYVYDGVEDVKYNPDHKYYAGAVITDEELYMIVINATLSMIVDAATINTYIFSQDISRTIAYIWDYWKPSHITLPNSTYYIDMANRLKMIIPGLRVAISGAYPYQLIRNLAESLESKKLTIYREAGCVEAIFNIVPCGMREFTCPRLATAAGLAWNSATTYMLFKFNGA